MDFGIQIEPQFGFSYDDIVAIGTAGEQAGFSRLWLSDARVSFDFARHDG